MPASERRLGAIMFTDIVGYSSIDEARALKLLQEHRTLLQPIFQKHGGTVVKTMGDAFLVEFPSAVEAVNSAIKAQAEMTSNNEGRAENDRILLRIGIHVGDIVHSQGDILGEAVNVASRLQLLAAPGGICLTRQVLDQIEGKTDYKFAKLGMRTLKNIQRPVELYRLDMPAGVSGSEETALDPRRIAILPFVNLSPDPNDRYFADGMTEEIISTVSRINRLSVISRTSVMRYKDTTTPVGDIARDLSVGTLLEGSVRKAGNKVRITTQLIDAKNDKHLWSQNYDRDLTDIFAVQGDIAEQVAGALKVTLFSKEKRTLGKKQTSSSESYMLYLKGRYLWNERSKEGIEKAIRYFEEAVRLDPKFALAYSGLADCYTVLIDRASVSYEETAPIARAHAEKALALDPELAEAHTSLGQVLYQKWDLDRAEKEFRQAISLKPNYSMAHHWYAGVLYRLGKFEEALKFEKQALKVDPHSAIVKQGVGISLLYLGSAREAVGQFQALEEIDPSFSPVHGWKAWAHERLGEYDLAIDEAKKLLGVAGNFAKLNLASIYARAGKREDAVKWLDDALHSREYIPPAWVAMVKLDLGQTDEGFSWLEKAYQKHDEFLMYFIEFPWTKQHRSDPRWLDIERHIGMSKRSAP